MNCQYDFCEFLEVAYMLVYPFLCLFAVCGFVFVIGLLILLLLLISSGMWEVRSGMHFEPPA